jgi:hypothetical protein
MCMTGRRPRVQLLGIVSLALSLALAAVWLATPHSHPKSTETSTAGLSYGAAQARALADALVPAAPDAAAYLSAATASPTPTATSTLAPAAAGDPRLIGAGDICIQSRLSQAQGTAALISARGADTVFTLGDNSNESGTAAQYSDCYGASWGSFLERTHATFGNHDFVTNDGAPYYAYFGTHAGPAGQGYYSYDLANSWHVIVLNSVCRNAGGCSSGSPQETWLRNDLAAHRGVHVIAMWHMPSFSSGGEQGNSPSYRAWWDDLYAVGAEIVLNGHDHDYERFARQNPAGTADPSGIREFVVGTGGAGTRSFGTIRANSEARGLDLGVLELTLGADSYSWQFISSDGSFSDSGTTPTHGTSTPPPGSATLTLASTVDGRGVQRVRIGREVTLHADLLPALANVQVTFQARPRLPGNAGFVEVGTATTSALGRAEILVTVNSNTEYRVLVGGGDGLGPATGQTTVDAYAGPALRIAGGYRTRLVSGYGPAAWVPNGTYVTLKAIVGSGPAASNVPVKFYVRAGKTGQWVLLSIGRTDASGACVWSRVVRVPPGATGYGRYLYFRAAVDATAAYAGGRSGGVRAVAR